MLPRAWRRESAFHGDEHWRCVTATGLAFASAGGGVDATLAFCFGLLHDTRRVNEHVDPEHGARAAAFAAELRDEDVLPLDERRFALLTSALVDHSNGLVSSDPTIGTCWDADRLHLPRVGIRPRTDLFSTLASHGAAPLAAAEALRADGPPAWDALVTAVDCLSHFRHEGDTDT